MNGIADLCVICTVANPLVDRRAMLNRKHEK